VTRYAFPGGCVVTVDDEHQLVTTRFPDGAELVAAPNHTPDDIARAHQLGYQGDVWAMTRDHDPAHTWLAEQDGYLWSWVMWDLAHGAEPDPWRVGPDEAAVLRFQAALDKAAPRPWDQYAVEAP
jgi:hypothetical protein